MKNDLNIKKIIIVLAITSVIGLLALLFFRNGDDEIVQNEFEIFFPYGEGGDANLGDELNQNNQTGDGQDQDGEQWSDLEQVPVLRKISANPIAGAIIFAKPKNKDEEINEDFIIRYIEKITGHIYETTANSLMQNRISNTTIPQVRDAMWLDENSLIIRYLDNDIIKTFSAESIIDEMGMQKLDGIFLQDGIENIIKFGEQIFYLLKWGEGAIGIMSDTNGDNKKQIFDSPLQEWLIDNIDNKNIAFATKPAESIRGFLFSFNPKTGDWNKILGNKPGLSLLTNSVSDVLYFINNALGPQLYILNNANKITSKFPLITFPEKCVWGKNNIYIYCGAPNQKLKNNSLEEWYKGKISFSDNIWRVNTQTNKTTQLIIPADAGGEEIDITKLAISENNKYLIFINKKDDNLWTLQLTNGDIF
ncbi:MAG: hypothetical protein ABIG87_00455 [Patescibacteria group bacterium]